jgi:hypothetical protein
MSEAPAIENMFPKFELVPQPRHWDIKFIRNFMLVLESVSSIFDFLTFGLLLWVCSRLVGSWSRWPRKYWSFSLFPPAEARYEADQIRSLQESRSPLQLLESCCPIPRSAVGSVLSTAIDLSGGIGCDGCLLSCAG